MVGDKGHRVQDTRYTRRSVISTGVGIFALSLRLCVFGFIVAAGMSNPVHAEQSAKDRYKEFIEGRVERVAHIARRMEMLPGGQKQAVNVDEFGEVEDSDWFTKSPFTFILDPQKLSVTSAWEFEDELSCWAFDKYDLERSMNYSVRFFKDKSKESMNKTGIISSKIIHAAGYNIPQRSMFKFEKELFEQTTKVKFTNFEGHLRTLSIAEFDSLIIVNYAESKNYANATASEMMKAAGKNTLLNLEKSPYGEIKNEDNRVLRGFSLFCKWIDMPNVQYYRAANFKTSFGFDFSNVTPTYFYCLVNNEAFGVNEYKNQSLRNKLDEFLMIEKNTNYASSIGGLTNRENELERNIEVVPFNPSRYFTAENFDPETYKFSHPNLAFDMMTNLDAYWATKIIMSFTDDDLRTIVEFAEFEDSTITEHYITTLAKRRDIIGETYFSKVNCLDNFVLTGSGESKTLEFDDLLVKYGFDNEGDTQYMCSLTCDGEPLVKSQYLGSAKSIQLPKLQRTNMNGVWELTLRTKRPGEKYWGKWVKVHLKVKWRDEELSIVGVDRQE